jgi:hypothetical protein
MTSDKTTDRRDRPHRTRSASPRRHRDGPSRHDHHTREEREKPKSTRNRPLPFKARELTKYDFKDYEALFSLYLDVQKQILLDDISSDEAKGRWKSFIGHWNRGELAEGWYDPSVKAKAENSLKDGSQKTNLNARAVNDEESEEDEVGPAPPGQISRSTKLGAVVPNAEDLAYRDGKLE